jgi:formate dehydrogenase maturation protein FdhE
VSSKEKVLSVYPDEGSEEQRVVATFGDESAAPVAPAAEDEIDALINEVAPPPLVVSEPAVRQLRPLLLELIARRKAEELIQEMVDALRKIEQETIDHVAVKIARTALTRAEEYRKGAKNA